MKQENEATVWNDEDEIQPEGGLTSEDINGSDDEEDVLEQLFAEANSDGDDHDETETDGADDDAPTTEQEAAAAETEGEEVEAPTTEQTQTAPRTLTFKIKRDHNEQEISLDESELPSIYQKASNYERLQRKYEDAVALNKETKSLAVQLGYTDIKAMVEEAKKSDRAAKIDALVNGGTTQEIAEDYVDRKIMAAQSTEEGEPDEQDETSTDDAANNRTEGADDTAYFRQQVSDFFAARPDLKGKVNSLPDEVSRAVVERKGSLRTLYAEWEAKQQKADAEKNRKEKELFAQQAAAASRAPVRGTPDAHTDKGEKPDALRSAFRSDNAW